MAMAAVAVAVAICAISMLLKVVYETVTCYWWTPRRIKKIMDKQGVRGPKPRFLLGNVLDMASLVSKSTSQDMDSINHDIVDRLLPHFVAWSRIYGKRFIFWNGTEPRMCLTESEMIKELLTKYSTISGKSWMQQQGAKHFVGRGLLMANGNDWYHQRHIVAPAFMGDKLKSYAGYMVECSEQMLQALKKEVESGEGEVEIGEYMTRLTADIISRTEFDSNYEKGKQIFHLLNLLQRLSAESARHLWLPGSRYGYPMGSLYAIHHIYEMEGRIDNVSVFTIFTKRFFPSKYNREAKSLKIEVERLLMEIIKTRKEGVEIGRSNSYGNDLLGLLLNEMQKNRFMSNGFSLNLQLIMDECKTFFFAGHETTALLLTWTVMLLATNPSWQDKIRDEVNHVCNGGIPSVDQLSKLTLLSMVINESMRLYPPAFLIPRMAFEDIKLGDLHIPKGLSIWIPILAIHHSEEIWGDDANEFKPERFASKSFATGRNFIPFAVGPRNCVGQSFALMEAKIILAMLVSKFRFTISENYRHAPVIVITVKPKYGVQIRLTPLAT